MACNYCEKSEELKKIMVHVCELPSSNVYLMRDQTYKGRCVVVFNQHKEEAYNLTDEERTAFFADICTVSEALQNLFEPDKLNLAAYGDTVRHLHFHVVPKYRDVENFGNPFTIATEHPVLLSEEDYAKRADEIKESIKRVAK